MDLARNVYSRELKIAAMRVRVAQVCAAFQPIQPRLFCAYLGSFVGLLVPHIYPSLADVG